LEQLLQSAIGLLRQRPEHVFHLNLDVLAPLNFVTRCLRGSLCRSSESVMRDGSLWFNIASTNVTSMDRLKESFKCRVWNAQGATGFDGAQATVIDPIVDDLTGDLEARGNIIGGEVIGSHKGSLLLGYNKYSLFIIGEGDIVKHGL
jgi:hypothetical protein